MIVVEGPDGTEYELPEPGEEVELTVVAEVLEISESDSRAPVVRYSFEPEIERLKGFTYDFYPWEVDTEIREEKE